MKKQLLILAAILSLHASAANAPRVGLDQAQLFLKSFRQGLDILDTQAAATFDETINFQPGLNLYVEAQRLNDIISEKGSQLCAPIAITHGMTYLRYAVPFANLKSVGDVDRDGTADTYGDKIRYFYDRCKTDRDGGTHYSDAMMCMREYIEESGYNSWAYMMGPHAPDAPAGLPIESTRHVVKVDDIRASVGHGFLVLMGIGWYRLDPATNTWNREGGHFFNVYGYDWMNAWGNEKMSLHVVNSWINYEGRARENMFDTISMTRIAGEAGVPAEVGFELKGTGFDFTTHRAFVEDIFPASPLK
ncbi:MAG: hypothetical protein ABIR96_06475 [Bdellovibrionota bacterium]